MQSIAVLSEKIHANRGIIYCQSAKTLSITGKPGEELRAEEGGKYFACCRQSCLTAVFAICAQFSAICAQLLQSVHSFCNLCTVFLETKDCRECETRRASQRDQTKPPLTLPPVMHFFKLSSGSSSALKNNDGQKIVPSNMALLVETWY